METSTSVKRLTARMYLEYKRGSVSRPEHREIVRRSEQSNGQLDREDQDPRRGLLFGGPVLETSVGPFYNLHGLVGDERKIVMDFAWGGGQSRKN